MDLISSDSDTELEVPPMSQKPMKAEQVPVEALGISSSSSSSVSPGVVLSEPTRLRDVQEPPSRLWRSGVLQPVAGVEVDLPLPEPLELLDAYLLPTFWNLWSEYRLQMESVGSSGLAPDIPTWAITLFSDPGFLWTSLRAQALSEALIIELRGQADVGQQQGLSDRMEDCGVPAEPSLPATKWGRCASLVPIIVCCIFFVSKLGHVHVTIGLVEIRLFQASFLQPTGVQAYPGQAWSIFGLLQEKLHEQSRSHGWRMEKITTVLARALARFLGTGGREFSACATSEISEIS